MASSIVKLFSGGPRFKRFWDQLEISLHEACLLEVDRLDSPDEAMVFHALRKRFTLYPIELGRFQAIAMKYRSPAAIAADDHRRKVQAIARISFSGSPVLLQMRPEEGFSFPFRGKNTKHSLLLYEHLPDFDACDFVERVNQELDRTRPLLQAFRDSVRAYDNRLIDRIQAKIACF